MPFRYFVLVADIYSFLPVYGISKWYDRNGTVDESSLIEILKDVDSKVTLSFILYQLELQTCGKVDLQPTDC